MALEVQQQMLVGDYRWLSAEEQRQESARDSALFSRKEGHEVVTMLQHLSNFFNFHRKEEVQEIEQIIQNELPGNIRDWQKAMLWLVDSYRTRHTLRSPSDSTFRTFTAPKFKSIRPSIFIPRNEIAADALRTEADTLGWDTVSVITLPMVNKTLVEEKVSPTSFAYKQDETWQVDGEFGNWELTTGGSGAILFLKTPIKRAKMTFTSQTLEFTEGYAAISIKLKYLPQPPAAEGTPASDDGDDGTPQYLSRNAQARSADDPAVVIQNVNYGNGPAPSPLLDSLFKGIISEWFNKNLDKFVYVFTVVNLNARAAKGEFQWLKPTYISYAYFDGKDADSSYFGVLNMVENASPEGLTNQLPPSAVPEGANSSLLISNKRFLKNIVLPGLPKAFVNAGESSFTIANNNTLIKNTEEVQMQDIDVNGLSYTPYLEDFKFQIVGDEIQVNTKTRITASPGINVFILSTSYYNVKLVNKPDGSQTLDYEESRPPESTDYYEKETWVIITEIIIGIIGAIVTIGAGKIIESVIKRIIAIVIIIIVAGLLAAIPTIIAKVMQGKAAEALPSIGELVTAAVGDIEWPKSSGLKLSKIELNGSLVMGGNLEYNEAS